MENLKDYVAIQEYRYGGRYSYFFDVDERCLDFKMPCMILQPLVENAIQHGIAMKMSGGCVWIRVFQTEDHICMEVRDNGVGMTPGSTRILKITDPPACTSGCGIFITESSCFTTGMQNLK